jgi:TrmH family RNA methyltransferase
MLWARVQRVTSRRNPLVARYRAAARGEGDRLMLLDGSHLIVAALDANVPIREAAIVSEALGREDLRRLTARLERTGAMLASVSSSVMRIVSPVRSASPIVAIAERPAYRAGEMYGVNPFLIIATDLQDPGNMGAIVRVAEAGGATGFVAAGACADPFGWKALRGSMGSSLRLPIIVEAEPGRAIAEARRHGCRIVAATPRSGKSLFEADLTRPMAAIVGGEGAGVPPALVDDADELMTIPMRPPVESLNAAVATALIVYEARRQRIRTSQV